MTKGNEYLKYYPVKISDKCWKFFVHDYENVEIFVYDKLPTREDLFRTEMTKEAIESYIRHDNYGDGSGRCKTIKDGERKIIIVAVYRLESETHYSHLSTACHELGHCAHRILESKGARQMCKYEESHLTIQDWLTETYFAIHLNGENFERLYEGRDLLWFKITTNS